MKILDLIGVKKDVNNKLTLELSANSQNHIGTIHAAAQFLLAETASGVYLQEQFPELKDKVIPLLRESQIKYKNIAEGVITADAFIDTEILERFKKQFLKKSRGTISVKVKLLNREGKTVTEGLFTWFIQRK
jgi:acyl-coenzyme A thioesterase PaaI-like protein